MAKLGENLARLKDAVTAWINPPTIKYDDPNSAEERMERIGKLVDQRRDALDRLLADSDDLERSNIPNVIGSINRQNLSCAELAQIEAGLIGRRMSTGHVIPGFLLRKTDSNLQNLDTATLELLVPMNLLLHVLEEHETVEIFQTKHPGFGFLVNQYMEHLQIRDLPGLIGYKDKLNEGFAV